MQDRYSHRCGAFRPAPRFRSCKTDQLTCSSSTCIQYLDSPLQDSKTMTSPMCRHAFDISSMLVMYAVMPHISGFGAWPHGQAYSREPESLKWPTRTRYVFGSSGHFTS